MTSDQPFVLCAGILVADLFVPPLAALPEPGQLIATEDFLMDSGGCAANTSTTLIRVGVKAKVAGKVGDDTYGSFIMQDLASKGVETAGISTSHRHGTSKTVILPVIGEDRRFIHTFGANAEFGAADIDREALAAAGVFYVGGYMVLPNLAQDDLAALFQLARSHSVCTALDVVVPGVLHRTGRYRTNGIERDHGFLKERLRPIRGLKWAASATIFTRGHALMRNIRRRFYRIVESVPQGLLFAWTWNRLAEAV